MGKISQVSSKYIINASIEIDGIVERPDVIGAVFGQTEGLLGTDLELRELQRSGRIGRIEVNLSTKDGKTAGTITIPSSLDKTETSMVAAALEVIQRIGPCNAKVTVHGIDDVRVSKRAYVLDRAKELLKGMVDTQGDTSEMTESVSGSVKAGKVVAIGKERLSAGPGVEESDNIIVVEGRADVVNLLKHGFLNAVAMNGTSCPETIKKLSKEKEVTVFVDGDRGGDLIIRELLTVADVDYITKAPDGKEVEELVGKELHKALRSRMVAHEVRDEFMKSRTSLRRRSLASKDDKRKRDSRGKDDKRPRRDDKRDDRQDNRRDRRRAPRAVRLSDAKKSQYKELLDSLVGTRGALILDKELNVLGKVPVKELAKTMESLKGSDANTVVFDGVVETEIADAADNAKVRTLVASDSNVDPRDTRVRVVTGEQLA